MVKCRPNILKSVAVAALLAAAPAAMGTLVPVAAEARTTLPAPYVSRALDAVLLPVDGTVTAAFGLPAGTRGVLVLATQPGGLADSAGVLPGDVLDYVRGTPILTPADLDLIIYDWILQGITDFIFDGQRGGSTFASETVITLEYWEETIEITEISTWESYSYESFSYEEYYAEYSEEIAESYEETVFEETTVNEEVVEDEVTEDEVAEDGAAEDDFAAGEDCAGEIVDGECMDGVAEDEGLDDAGAEEDAAEEDFADDDMGGDEDAGGDEEIIE